MSKNAKVYKKEYEELYGENKNKYYMRSVTQTIRSRGGEKFCGDTGEDPTEFHASRDSEKYLSPSVTPFTFHFL